MSEVMNVGVMNVGQSLKTQYIETVEDFLKGAILISMS